MAGGGRGEEGGSAQPKTRTSRKDVGEKYVQTEIDFDVGSRLPLGAAIQNINPCRVGLRFIDGCFRDLFGVGLKFFGGSVQGLVQVCLRLL